jgi:hypothetical protein
VSSADSRPLSEIALDEQHLYREETFTDLRVGSIRRLVPVRPDGSDDPSREPLFLGQTQLLSQAGPVPVSCPIEAATLREAIQKFPQAMNDAVERLIEEAREIQRQEMSRIVVPTVAPGSGPPGGGKIIL